MMTGHIKL